MKAQIFYAYEPDFHKNSDHFCPGITHGFVKDIDVDGDTKHHCLENAFFQMQSERWSPNGEARNLIERKALHHTSLSVGDVVVLDGKAWMCTNDGWEEIEQRERYIIVHHVKSYTEHVITAETESVLCGRNIVSYFKGSSGLDGHRCKHCEPYFDQAHHDMEIWHKRHLDIREAELRVHERVLRENQALHSAAVDTIVDILEEHGISINEVKKLVRGSRVEFEIAGHKFEIRGTF